MAVDKNIELEARVREDQLADLKAGFFFSMPISTVLSVLILGVQWMAGGGFSATIWFLVVNAINATRLVLALYLPTPARASRENNLQAILLQLRLYSGLALLAGFAWSFLAVLTAGYTQPQSPLHLIILAGISAGSVTYGSSYAPTPINFIVPPLLVAAGCLAIKGNVEDYVLAFSVLLFLGGMIRGSFLGQARFCEASRLRHEAEQFAAEMERNSREDPLTSLLNRRGLEHAVDNLKDVDGPFVSMLIDLDGFKAVNDTYGHKVGDDLLTSIADRIKRQAPEGATIARIGGDEFVVVFLLLDNLPSPGEFASQMIAEITNPYPTLASVRIGASVGIYLSGRPNLAEILSRADVALYTAKSRGRNEFCVFTEELDQILQRRQCIERDLGPAIETRDIAIWFQPVVALDSGSVVGFEALLRWFHPHHGTISPPEIVMAARETGMLQKLTEAVFYSCCSLLRDLARSGCHEFRVAMNVSPRELEAGNIDDFILEGLQTNDLPASMFEIEITEEAPVDQERVEEKLGRLSDAGVSIAIDDFGTGFSTLASLKNGRINKVKIDKTFIRGLAQSPGDQLLVGAVINLGRTLGIEVVAEGVETDADRKVLQSLGCRTAQGFLFSEAVPAKQALETAKLEQAKHSE